MIRLNISDLIFLYILSTAVVIMVVWVAGCYRKGYMQSRPAAAEYIWKCGVCANIYIDSRHEDMSACPLCGSYNKREVKG